MSSAKRFPPCRSVAVEIPARGRYRPSGAICTTHVEATQFRDPIHANSKSLYTSRLRACRNGLALSSQTPINKTESGTIRDGRSHRSRCRLTCCETHLSSAAYRLNPGPSGEDAENVSANLAMSDHLSRASWIDRYRGSKHLMSLARLV
jgi:hypothetical protein